MYVTNMVSTNFFGLYVTQRLGLSENFLALFPILNAAVMLIVMIGLQHRINACRLYTSVDAIRARDSEAARQAMRVHLEDNRRSIEALPDDDS